VQILVTKYPDNGWMVHFDDNATYMCEADKVENVYVIMGEKGSLIKFDDSGDQAWARNIKGEDPYTEIWDLYFNQYLYVSGRNRNCTDGYSYIAGMYGTSNSKYWVDDDCVERYYMGGQCITGNSGGISYVCSSGYYDPVMGDTSNKEKILKHNAAGDVLWVRDYDGVYGDIEFQDLTIVETDSFYGVGHFYGPQVDFDLYNTGGEVDGSDLPDGFLAKYDSSGYLSQLALLRANDDGNSIIYAYSIVLDDSNNILISGPFHGIVDFDPGAGTYELNGGYSYFDIFLCKYDSDFNLINVISIGNEINGITFGDITTDLDGNLFITGTFYDIIDFDPGPSHRDRTPIGGSDIFLLKLNSNMDFVWVQTWGSMENDYGNDVACNALTGAIYLVGGFSGTMDFNPGDGVFEKTPIGDVPDSFLIKVLSNGYWE
jgi:hypothetical protein